TLHTEKGRATAELRGTWFTNGFQGAMGELLCAIEDDREPGHSARQNLDRLALCFAALASAEAGTAQVPGSVTRAG
ncbi:MAG: Gfo/Idh/MocA family protein, partial [Opitutaceae bacterium]